MSSSVRDFVEDANDRTLVRVCEGSDSSNWHIAHLVIVNSCDVDMSAIRGFADENAICTAYKAISAAVDESVIRATNIPFTYSVRRVWCDGVADIFIRRKPCVEFDIKISQGFSVAIVNAVWRITEKSSRMGVPEFTTEWFTRCGTPGLSAGFDGNVSAPRDS